MRLIDADELLDWSEIIPLTDDGGIDINDFEEKLKTMPTIDAAPVIRCRDCKHYDGYCCHNKWWGDGYGSYTPPIKSDDGFCDWAERKEE